EVLLDHIALVAQADHKVVDAVMRVELEDVPEHGFAADLDHGLGAHRGFFGQARAQAAGEDDGLHVAFSGVGCSASRWSGARPASWRAHMRASRSSKSRV